MQSRVSQRAHIGILAYLVIGALVAQDAMWAIVSWSRVLDELIDGILLLPSTRPWLFLARGIFLLMSVPTDMRNA